MPDQEARRRRRNEQLAFARFPHWPARRVAGLGRRQGFVAALSPPGGRSRLGSTRCTWPDRLGPIVSDRPGVPLTDRPGPLGLVCHAAWRNDVGVAVGGPIGAGLLFCPLLAPWRDLAAIGFCFWGTANVPGLVTIHTDMEAVVIRDGMAYATEGLFYRAIAAIGVMQTRFETAYQRFFDREVPQEHQGHTTVGQRRPRPRRAGPVRRARPRQRMGPGRRGVVDRARG